MTKNKDAVPAPGKGGTPAKRTQEDAEFEGLMAEVEADLREDEFKKLWRKYGNLLIAFLVAVVVGVAGVQIYREYETTRGEQMAKEYTAAITTLRAGRTDEALTALAALGAKGGNGYGALARLSQAALQVEKNDIGDAIATYTAIATDNAVDPVFRDLATVLRVLHSLEREDAKTLEALIEPLAAPGQTFEYSARELKGLLAAKQGEITRAAEIASQLAADPAAPQGIRTRAEDLAALYKSSAPAAAPAAAAVPAPGDAPPAAPKP